MASGCSSKWVVMPGTLLLLATTALPFYARAETTAEQIAAHFKAAQEAERRNDFPAAVRQHEYLASVLPRNAEIQSNLGVALYFNHELKRAIAIFHRATAINPNLLAPHLFSGLAWYRLSNPDAAVPELEKAVSINGSDVLAHTWLGYGYIAQSRYGAATKEFEAACRLDPDNVDAWYALGQSYLQIGKDMTVKLIETAPDGGRVWQLAGEQYQLQGNSQRALEAYREAIKRRQDVPELPALIAGVGGGIVESTTVSPVSINRKQEDDLYRLAHDAEQQASAAFGRVIQISPDSYRAQQIMADAFIAEQQPEQAIKEYRTVLKLKPDLPGIHEAIGSSLVVSGKLPEALKEFQAELEIEPNSATAHMNIGRILLMTGDDDGARVMLTAALQLDRPPLETYSLLGKLALRSGDYGQAIAMLTHYISIEKGNSDAYYQLARAYRAIDDKNQMNKSLDLYKKTSRDARERSLAQKELEPAKEMGGQSEDTVEALKTVEGAQRGVPK